MGMDQAYEQNNKLVKIGGGVIGILENDNAMLKWTVALDLSLVTSQPAFTAQR